jgi:ribosome biogenesis GTPase
MKRGRVLSILGEKIKVLAGSEICLCSIRGVLKKKVLKKSILAVGDFVLISKDNTIEKIEKRHSILSRESPTGKKEKIIAANIDQVFIVSSIFSPPLNPNLIDRYIIASIKGNMTPIIVFNKTDLLEKDLSEKKLYLECLDAYKKADIQTISVSCKTKKNINNLKKLMKNKASVFTGKSGTGKSSLINATLKKNLKTGSLTKIKKGAHITSKANLIPLKDKGFCIDTPGIKSFGIWDIKKEDIKNYFFEFSKFSKNCKFSNCMHLREPLCAVIEAFQKNQISPLRFNSYRSLMKEKKDKKDV